MAARLRPVPAWLGSLRASVPGAVLGAILFGVLMGATRPAAATVMTVTSLAEFNAAIGAAPTIGDPFDNDIAGGLSITFDSEVVSAISGGNLANAAQDNQVTGGAFVGEVDGDGLDAPMVMTWTFASPVIAFGLDFAITGRLDATIVGSGQPIDIGNTIGRTSGFFGLVDTMTPFTQVQFTVFDNSRNDAFSGDNLIFAAAPLVIPEPGTLALFALGLGSLALLGYRGRRGRA